MRVERPAAVLFDRDGTLVHDVPYNGDPALVRPVDGAREALDRLRAAGAAVCVVLAGGYADDIRDTVDINAATAAAVARRLG